MKAIRHQIRVARPSVTHLGRNNSRLNLGCGIRSRNRRNGSVRTLDEEGSIGRDRLSRSDSSSGEGGGGYRSEERRGGGDASREGGCGFKVCL